ncbi:MAG: UDP-3-O-(3-hydroxymyristoyl)glucosamine N-acyltransferase [Candidatus Omnitrophica bacterium]|nr:UDP-3-O-(3-hydroxymyristoyl)glucosamine N-acyltransferase [Candidatus Omnitrophota bacterium]
MNPAPRKNSEKPKSLKLEKIAELVEGKIVGNAQLAITGVAGIREAKEGDITFLSNAKYLPFLSRTRASAVITSKEIKSGKKTLVLTNNPSLAFAKVISLFKPTVVSKAQGVHPTAVLDPSVRLGPGVSVGPQAVIEADVVIGKDTVIEAHTFIGRGSVIGSGVWVYPNVTLREETHVGERVIIHSGSVIGSDGFGYETVDDVHIKIPQTGTVWIEDDVEIGANVCIDRGRFDRTWIKKGTKIDNLVQIAHNVVVGENSLIVSQAGISGSTVLGKNVVVAGQAGIVGHITLGDEAIVGAQSGVSKSIPAKTTVLGSPAKPIEEQRKLFALIARLPELFKELAELNKKF